MHKSSGSAWRVPRTSSCVCNWSDVHKRRSDNPTGDMRNQKKKHTQPSFRLTRSMTSSCPRLRSCSFILQTLQKALAGSGKIGPTLPFWRSRRYPNSSGCSRREGRIPRRKNCPWTSGSLWITSFFLSKKVTRAIYERKKTSFPASRWEVFDPSKKFEKYTIHGN